MFELQATLLTQTHDVREVLELPEHMEGSFPVRIVKGLEIPASRTLLDPAIGCKDVDEEPIYWPDIKVHRLAEFISRIVVAKEPLYRNCVTFAAFMHSGASLDTARKDMKVSTGSITEVWPDDLLSGNSYLLYLEDQRTAVHAAVGVEDPSEHMAVWGDGKPLAIGANQDMLDLYRALHVMEPEVTGRFDLS